MATPHHLIPDVLVWLAAVTLAVVGTIYGIPEMRQQTASQSKAVFIPIIALGLCFIYIAWGWY